MTVSIEEAAGSLPDLVAKAAGGEDIVIETAGHPVARLVKVDIVMESKPRQLGFLKGRIHISENFDDPLPDDILRGFGVID